MRKPIGSKKRSSHHRRPKPRALGKPMRSMRRTGGTKTGSIQVAGTGPAMSPAALKMGGLS